MHRVLITGVGGFIGSALAKFCSSQNETIGTIHSTDAPEESVLGQILRLDVRDSGQVCEAISRYSPTTIIHCAAFNGIIPCARNPDLAIEVNVHGTENIARAAEKVGAKLVYLSTDIVFNGGKGNYSEDDLPDPICTYGKTKLEAEEVVKSVCSIYIVGRVALVYGINRYRKRFTEQVIESLQRGDKIQLFSDEYRSQIYLPVLCNTLVELATGDLNGTYHLCGNDSISRLEFGLELARVFGLNPNLIMPTTSADFQSDEKRPLNCSMTNGKLRRDLKTEMPSLREALKELHQEYQRIS